MCARAGEQRAAPDERRMASWAALAGERERSADGALERMYRFRMAGGPPLTSYGLPADGVWAGFRRLRTAGHGLPATDCRRERPSES
jgi:hypothetical protein